MTYKSTRPFSLHQRLLFPVSGGEAVQQLEDCYNQLEEFFRDKGLPMNSVVKQTIFVSADSANHFYQTQEKLLACAVNRFENLPATAILAESPEEGMVAVELMYCDAESDHPRRQLSGENISGLILEAGDAKLVVASVSASRTEELPFREKCMQAFDGIRKILEEEKLGFQHIVRQWNYIEQIIGFEKGEQGVNQHYQVFNDVRSAFYSEADFTNGYPAATGIGTDFGGISIEIIACSLPEGDRLIPVKSPVQKDAYRYTTEVLAANDSLPENRTTPKFERAKLWQSAFGSLVFISGTAAIKGQESDHQSAEQQTELTIGNIRQLISAENLAVHGAHSGKAPELNQLRVYVKHRRDLSGVKAIVSRLLPGIPVVYVLADVCRPELLVEIEGIAIQTR